MSNTEHHLANIDAIVITTVQLLETLISSGADPEVNSVKVQCAATTPENERLLFADDDSDSEPLFGSLASSFSEAILLAISSLVDSEQEREIPEAITLDDEEESTSVESSADLTPTNPCKKSSVVIEQKEDDFQQIISPKDQLTAIAEKMEKEIDNEIPFRDKILFTKKHIVPFLKQASFMPRNWPTYLFEAFKANGIRSRACGVRNIRLNDDWKWSLQISQWDDETIEVFRNTVCRKRDRERQRVDSSFMTNAISLYKVCKEQLKASLEKVSEKHEGMFRSGVLTPSFALAMPGSFIKKVNKVKREAAIEKKKKKIRKKIRDEPEESSEDTKKRLACLGACSMIVRSIRRISQEINISGVPTAHCAKKIVNVHNKGAMLYGVEPCSLCTDNIELIFELAEGTQRDPETSMMSEAEKKVLDALRIIADF